MIHQNIQILENNLSQVAPNNNQPYNFNLHTDPNLLLYLINTSIVVPDHNHPLYSCFTPEKQQFSNFWTCKKCQCKYVNNVPSFYCTACDYDLCQKCILALQVYQIQRYNYSMNINFNFNCNPNHRNYKPNIHNHAMALINIENYNNPPYILHCKKCSRDIISSECFYYCSLCNFYICQQCFNIQQSKNMAPIYNFRGIPNNQNSNYNPNNNQNNMQGFNNNNNPNNNQNNMPVFNNNNNPNNNQNNMPNFNNNNNPNNNQNNMPNFNNNNNPNNNQNNMQVFNNNNNPNNNQNNMPNFNNNNNQNNMQGFNNKINLINVKGSNNSINNHSNNNNQGINNNMHQGGLNINNNNINSPSDYLSADQMEPNNDAQS